jgi:hypothetical protein
MLRKIPKEGRSHLHCGGSLKSRIELQIVDQHIIKFEKREANNGTSNKAMVFSTDVTTRRSGMA